uniref:ATPase Na+/K+ transporting subunit beta 1b n=1 Tax=Cyprinus carpio TaxID=7962 RepID=A0A8C1LD79_CYPCA
MPAQNKDDGGWKKFLWNSEKKEFLGRTGSSWSKIFLFYLVFYGFLAGIFIGTIQILLLTLSDYKPTWQDRVAPPGLTHYPRSDKAELIINPEDDDTYRTYTKAMKDFLVSYDIENQGDQMKFEACGGIRLHICFLIVVFYYSSSISCCLFIILIFFLHFYLYHPPTSNESIPEEAWHKVQPNVIPLHCTNKKEEDAGKLGEVKYYGISEGFPLQYYPYYGKRLHFHYLQPLVAVQFVNITLNTEIRVECKVFGQNIYYSDKDRYQGRFDVKIGVMTKSS